MAERQDERPMGRGTRAAGIAFFTTAVLGAGYLIYEQSTRLLVCYETNATLSDDAYVDIMIRDIVKNGDHGGRSYASKLAYLEDKTACCTIERVPSALIEGRPVKREVSVSARYFNTTMQDYFFIERRYDACGHASSKPMTAG
ncbi:hypothetical protein [Methylobacterium sp. Leaf117]|uniref:hypothetical protein n=1 Tax=Methylobacterium sp. Leaf117 TaxID=1736260 RepID=UPI000728E418|nr:hypothetical protein [Methylobacterium sp. Leaf117]KQP83061.1 hypothetical protein ASF57_13240 [Methylobacterium sp. Leaf117]